MMCKRQFKQYGATKSSSPAQQSGFRKHSVGQQPNCLPKTKSVAEGALQWPKRGRIAFNWPFLSGFASRGATSWGFVFNPIRFSSSSADTATLPHQCIGIAGAFQRKAARDNIRRVQIPAYPVAPPALPSARSR